MCQQDQDVAKLTSGFEKVPTIQTYNIWTEIIIHTFYTIQVIKEQFLQWNS